MLASPADRAALAEAAQKVAAAGLVTGSGGNVSVRRGERMLITPRGAPLEAVQPEACVEVGLADGSAPAGARPSSETPLHRAAYAATGAGAIVHTHSHFATVVGTLVGELPPIHYAIEAFGGDTVRVARYETFGTPALAEAVSEALADRTGALMANHGAIVCGRDLEHAVGLAVTLEWLASVYYHARLAGSPQILSAADVEAVREQLAALDYY